MKVRDLVERLSEVSSSLHEAKGGAPEIEVAQTILRGLPRKPLSASTKLNSKFVKSHGRPSVVMTYERGDRKQILKRINILFRDAPGTAYIDEVHSAKVSFKNKTVVIRANPFFGQDWDDPDMFQVIKFDDVEFVGIGD